MRLDAFGRVLNPDAPATVGCTACDGHAEWLSSAWQGEGIVYHHYRCRDDCPAGGTIVEHDAGSNRRVGPVFHAPRTQHPAPRADHPTSGTVRADKQSERERPTEVREVMS